MSWYFLGGFSAYLSVPSGRRWNHSGCSFSHGWSGEHWIAKSSAISTPSSRARATRRSNSSCVPRSGWIASCPPSLAPIAQGLPTSPRFAVTALLRPLRLVCPIGWIGGREITSNPSSESCGRTFSTPAKPPNDLGNSSYQAPKRASGTSASMPNLTSSSTSSYRSLLGAARSSSSDMSGPSRARPSESSPSNSVCPPSTFRVTSSCHDAIRSTHAATVYVQRPGLSTANEPRHRSLPSGSSGDSRQRRAPGPRYRTGPRSTAGPARKIVAFTMTSSPTTRLIEKCPQFTCGSTSWIWIPGGGALRGLGMGTRLSQLMRLKRASGVLLHPTSLPGGRLGDDASRFVDWLAAAGQSWWQVLPLGPPDTDRSPYNAASAFAGSAQLLDEPRARVSAADV